MKTTIKKWKDIAINEPCDVGLNTPVWGKKSTYCTHTCNQGFVSSRYPEEGVKALYDPDYELRVQQENYTFQDTGISTPERKKIRTSKALQVEITNYYLNHKNEDKQIINTISKKYGIKKQTINSMIRR